MPALVRIDPPTSPHRAVITAAAVSVGARVVDRAPDDATLLAVVVDQAGGGTHTGPDALVIGDDPRAWECIAPVDLAARLPRALRNLLEAVDLRGRVVDEEQIVTALNRIGYALAAIPDRHQLLDEILVQATQLLRADGGTIYLHQEGTLRFGAARNDTVPFSGTRLLLPVDETSLAGFVALHRAPLNVPDVRMLPQDAPYRPNLSFDQRTGYRTHSMLLVPLLDRAGAVLGVLALVNRKPWPGTPLTDFSVVTPFSERELGLARSIAAQAAVALENSRLHRDIQRLFRGFVEASVTAIEQRDPSTGGHSHRVATLTTRLARAVHDSDELPFQDIHFRPSELTELGYAALLHDFGKVGVREEVLLKAKRLHPWEIDGIELRFRLAALEAVLEATRAGLPREALDQRLRAIELDLRTVQRLSLPSIGLTEADRAEVAAIAERWMLTDVPEPVVAPPQVRRICYSFGSLDGPERAEIESHVEHTWRFLQRIPWTRELRRVPELAYAHHEKLDGSGYPRKLVGAEIPFGSRLMTVADIYDALTAGDRPYKAGMTPEAAIGILKEEAARGRVDGDVVALLAARRLWV